MVQAIFGLALVLVQAQVAEQETIILHTNFDSIPAITNIGDFTTKLNRFEDLLSAYMHEQYPMWRFVGSKDQKPEWPSLTLVVESLGHFPENNCTLQFHLKTPNKKLHVMPEEPARFCYAYQIKETFESENKDAFFSKLLALMKVAITTVDEKHLTPKLQENVRICNGLVNLTQPALPLPWDECWKISLSTFRLDGHKGTDQAQVVSMGAGSIGDKWLGIKHHELTVGLAPSINVDNQPNALQGLTVHSVFVKELKFVYDRPSSEFKIAPDPK